MRIILLFLSCVCISFTAFAQDTVAIPKGVKYKKTSDVINNKAKDLILKELTSNGTYNLFDSIVIIGPALWDRYSKIKNIAVILCIILQEANCF